MIVPRRSEDRGHADHGWLDTRHTFSFADYYDPEQMGFGVLRVINEDRVAPGEGFPTHGHRDMEIVTYVLEGQLEHKDSMGNGSVIRPGDLQRMSAGTGVRHSEYNASSTEPVHFLQVWILPDRAGLPPGYEQKRIDLGTGQLRLVGSSNGRDASLTIHQDVLIFAAKLQQGERVSYRPHASRKVYAHMARGSVKVNDQALAAGDGARIAEEKELSFVATQDAEFLLFDMGG